MSKESGFLTKEYVESMGGVWFELTEEEEKQVFQEETQEGQMTVLNQIVENYRRKMFPQLYASY